MVAEDKSGDAWFPGGPNPRRPLEWDDRDLSMMQSLRRVQVVEGERFGDVVIVGEIEEDLIDEADGDEDVAPVRIWLKEGTDGENRSVTVYINRQEARTIGEALLKLADTP